MKLEKHRPLLPKWYTNRFVRAEPKESPADQNVSLIRDAFATLTARAAAEKPDALFSLEHPVTLITKTSEPFKGMFQYTLRRGNAFDFSYLVSELKILQKKKWVSKRIWYIDILDEARIGHYVDFSSESDTKRKWEGNRFGSALLLLTNDVIRHLMRHNTHFDELPVKSIITDGATGQFPDFKYRRGWTSHHAKALGYTKIDRNDFERWYRVTDPVRMYIDQDAKLKEQETEAIFPETYLSRY